MAAMKVTNLGGNPSVFIGLGGSGARIVAHLKRQIEQLIPDPDNPARQTIQFLVLDADAFESLPAVGQKMLDPKEEFLFLGDVSPREYVLAQKRGATAAWQDLRRWLGDEPSRDLLSQLPEGRVYKGAERLRILSRILFYAHRKEVETRIREKYTAAMNARQAMGQGGLLPEHREVYTYLITSTCGGTGSGVFLDTLHMVHRIRSEDQTFESVFEAILLMPEFYIALHEMKEGSRSLVPYYQANGYAFFQELRYFLQDPQRLNDYVSDAITEGRSATPGQGVPEGQSLLQWAYLFDHRIPDLGAQDLSRPEDYYAFVSRAFFQHLMGIAAAEVDQNGQRVQGQDVIGQKVVNFRSLSQTLDDQKTPRIFVGMGHSEIVYPAAAYRSYFIHSVARRFLEEQLLGQAPAPVIDGMVENLERGCRNLLDEVNIHLEPACQKVIQATTRDLQDFLGPDGQTIDENRIAAASLAGLAAQARQVLEGLEARLELDWMKVSGTLQRKFALMVEEEILSASGQRGFLTTVEVLKALDLRMEALGQSMAASARGLLDEVRKELDALAGTDPDSPATVVLARDKTFRKKAAQEQRLQDFLNRLANAVTRACDARKEMLRARMLQVLVGDPGDRNPIVPVIDERTGIKVGEKTMVSVLDVHQDQVVDRLMGVFRQGQGLFHDADWQRRFRIIEASSVSTQYLPSNPTIDELRKNEELSLQVQKALEEPTLSSIWKAFLADLRDRYSGDRQKLLTDPSWLLDALEQAVAKAVDFQWIKGEILPLPVSDKERGEVLNRFHKSTAVALPISGNVDRGTTSHSTIRFVVSTGSDSEVDSILPPGGDWARVQGYDPSMVALQQETYIISLRDLDSLRILAPFYHRRDRKKNWPHIDVRFQRIGVPGVDGTLEEGLWYFGFARAIDQALEVRSEQEQKTLLEQIGIPVDRQALSPFRFFRKVRLPARAGTFQSEDQFQAICYRKVESGNQECWQEVRAVSLGGANNLIACVERYLEQIDVWENHGEILRRCTETEERRKVLEPILKIYLEKVETLEGQCRQQAQREESEESLRRHRTIWRLAEAMRRQIVGTPSSDSTDMAL